MPIYHKNNAAAIKGPGQDLLWPAYRERLDYKLEIDLWLRPGDVIELEIGRVGVLQNRIVRR